MSARSQHTASDRVVVFDGLRGIAIILVVLSHIWWVWDTARTYENPAAKMLLQNGNYAVSFFFVVGAFLYTRSLLARAASSTGLHPGVQVLRRLIRLTPAVAIMLLILAVIEKVEPLYSDRDMGTSSLRVLTYTWNWYVRDHAFTARDDLGHLWYLSVDMQVFLLVLLLVWFLHKRPLWLIATLAALLVMVFMWRSHVYETEGIFQALLRTNARMDAPLSGALAACLVPYVQRLGPELLTKVAPPVAWGSLVLLFTLSYWTTNEVNFFELAGNLVDVALALFVLACSVAPVSKPLTSVLGNIPLAYLGRHSLSLYIWHFPIFQQFHYHTVEWSRAATTAAALAVTIVVAHLNDRTVEAFVSKALRNPGWRLLDMGIPHFVAQLTGGSTTSLSRQDEVTPEPTSQQPATPAVVKDLTSDPALGVRQGSQDDI